MGFGSICLYDVGWRVKVKRTKHEASKFNSFDTEKMKKEKSLFMGFFLKLHGVKTRCQN